MALSSDQIITCLRNEYLRITGINNIDFCTSTDLRNKNRQGNKKLLGEFSYCSLFQMRKRRQFHYFGFCVRLFKETEHYLIMYVNT